MTEKNKGGIEVYSQVYSMGGVVPTPSRIERSEDHSFLSDHVLESCGMPIRMEPCPRQAILFT